MTSIWSDVCSFLAGLLLLVPAAAGIALGVGAVRDIRTGKTRSLSRMSARRYDRAENPTAFWITIGTGLLWGALGAFLLTILVAHMLGA